MTAKDFSRLNIEDDELEGEIEILRATRLERGDPTKFQILHYPRRGKNYALDSLTLLEEFDSEAERDEALLQLPGCVARNPDDRDRKDPRNLMRVL